MTGFFFPKPYHIFKTASEATEIPKLLSYQKLPFA
jgi:hypothetical protein